MLSSDGPLLAAPGTKAGGVTSELTWDARLAATAITHIRWHLGSMSAVVMRSISEFEPRLSLAFLCFCFSCFLHVPASFFIFILSFCSASCVLVPHLALWLSSIKSRAFGSVAQVLMDQSALNRTSAPARMIILFRNFWNRHSPKFMLLGLRCFLTAELALSDLWCQT